MGTIAKRVILDGVLYQLEYRRCGKRPGARGRPNGCRCMRSDNPLDWHGPYPYAYTTARKRGGDVLTTGGWKRLKVFPEAGFAALGVELPE